MALRGHALLAACVALPLALSACATSPLDTSGIDSQRSPRQMVEAMPGKVATRVQWGGRIVSVVNQEQATLIEVLSYPVSRDGLPNIYRKPTGRFVLRRGGFLEPRDYAPGRLVTVVGTVRAMTRTTVGGADLVVPLLRAEQLHLWAERYQHRSGPRFGFGLGISIGL